MRSEKARKAFNDLMDDYHRQGGSLSQEQVDRLVVKRGLTPKETLEVFKELSQNDIFLEYELDPAEFELPAETNQYEPTSYDFLRIAKSYPLLKPQEEVALGRAVAVMQNTEAGLKDGSIEPGDETTAIIRRGNEAREKLTCSNIRLVMWVAKRYQYITGMDFDDLVQEGIIGLMRAALKFDYSLGYRFSTYATWWIIQSILRAIADKDQIIRFPVHVVEKLMKVRRARRVLYQIYGKENPSPLEIAEEVGMNSETVHFLQQLEQVNPISLDMKISGNGDDKMSLMEVIPCHRPSPEEEITEVEKRDHIEEVLARLSTRQRDIIGKRFGLEGYGMTLEELGREYDLTRERIRQIQEKALHRLRVPAVHKDLKDYWK